MRRLALLLAVAHLTSSLAARAQEPGPLPPLPPSTPAPSEPPPAPAFTPPGAPGGGEPTIRFDPAEPDLTLLARSGDTLVFGLQRFRRSWWVTANVAYLYAPICHGPCVTRVPPGQYHLALAKGHGDAVPAGPVAVAGPSALHAEYTDRSGLRTAGTVIGIGGILGGIALVVAGVGRSDAEHTEGALIGGGVALMLTSGLVGSILALQRDEARITVTPLAAPPAASRESPLVAVPRPQGAGLALRF